MIVIDGKTTDLSVKNFSNLEDLLTNVMEEDTMNQRIVTDVLVDDEAFSEIYPHQSEDIETNDFNKVEIVTMDTTNMAINITRELAEQRAQIVDSVLESDHHANRDQFLEKLSKLQKMQTRITESAKKLHSVLSSELKRVKTENTRFTGYKKATTVTPLFNPYLNKKG
ncbi:MAG: hypothetical protein LC631_00755 [Desulfovibrionales bacterium]|nr:hypothetical protein [Desulfovibrionales bacterium]